MNKIHTLKIKWVFVIYVILDIFLIGCGMGVPFFNILFGLPFGWYLTKRESLHPYDTLQILCKVLLWAAFTSLLTCFGMILLWGPWVLRLLEPNADLGKLGAPLILYEPIASFIGWLILMIIISPFLQFLMTLFGSYLALLSWLKKQI